MKVLLPYEAPEVLPIRLDLKEPLLTGSPTGESFDDPIEYGDFVMQMDMSSLFEGLL